MKKLPVIISAAISIIIFSACNINNNNTNPEQGYFLIANLSPDAPALSVSLNNSPFATGLSYGVYTPYYNTNAGSYTFAFYNASSSPVFSNTVAIEATKAYSYIVIDSFSKVQSVFIEDKFSAPSADSVYIRFFNFCPNSGALNLFDSTANLNLYSVRSFNDQSFNSGYTSFDRIPAGIYSLQLKDPGGTVLASKTDTLTGGHVYSILAKGVIGGASGHELGIGQIQNY